MTEEQDPGNQEISLAPWNIPIESGDVEAIRNAGEEARRCYPLEVDPPKPENCRDWRKLVFICKAESIAPNETSK